MLKKFTGIFILLTFLLVKSTPLLAIDEVKQSITLNCTDQQETEETPDTDRESNQLETLDEDFTVAVIAVPGFLMLLDESCLFDVGGIPIAYISLPYLPPNCRLG